MTKREIFKFDWVDNKWFKIDNLGFTVVNLNRNGHKFDCFILALHAKQVFYMKDQVDKKINCLTSGSKS